MGYEFVKGSQELENQSTDSLVVRHLSPFPHKTTRDLSLVVAPLVRDFGSACVRAFVLVLV